MVVAGVVFYTAGQKLLANLKDFRMQYSVDIL